MKSDATDYLPVIKKLLERTKQGRVRWQGELGAFSCALLGGKAEDTLEFTLSTVASSNINYDVRFLVMADAKGNELFRVEASDLPTSPREEEISSLINELYDLARRQALRVDEKLDLASSLLDRT
jgi:hypothetical protein